MRRLERHLKDAEAEPANVADVVTVSIDGSGDVYVNGVHGARVMVFVMPAVGSDSNRIAASGYVDGLDGWHSPELAPLDDGRVEVSLQRGAESLALAAIAYYLCGFIVPCSASFKLIKEPQVKVSDGEAGLVVVGYPDHVVSYLLGP